MHIAIRTRIVLLQHFAKRCKSRCKQYSDLSYLHRPGTEPLQYITLGNLLENTALKYRDRPFIISRHQKKSISFGDLLEQADRLAAGLLATGLKRGDRIGLCLPNRYEWNVVFFACTRADLILVALNPAYQSPEIEYCINKVGISAMIFQDNFKTQNYYEILRNVCPEICNSEPGRIKAAKVPTLRTAIFMSEKSFKGAYNYDELLKLGSENVVNNIRNEQYSISSDNPTVIQFTSGTTGKAKATVSSHFNMINNSYAIAKRTELDTKHHIACLPNPLFHAFGIVISTLSAMHFGTTLVLPGAAYNPNESLDALKEEKCTIAYGTPTMHVDLVNVQSKRKEDINPEIALTGGAVCSESLFKSMLDVLKVKKVKSVYGLTETTAVAFHSNPDDDLRKSTTTVGCISDHLEVKVTDSEGKLVPFGQRGELCVRGYLNMLGYWDDEEKTKETMVDGWLKTGDLFILEKDGYGTIVGRIKDMIIRGGENIFPKEIEDYLNTHPEILEAHVVGVPHERLGEEVGAVVRLKEQTTVGQTELIQFCKGKLAYFKIPTKWRIVEDLPKTTSGKVQKFKLKELF